MKLTTQQAVAASIGAVIAVVFCVAALRCNEEQRAASKLAQALKTCLPGETHGAAGSATRATTPICFAAGDPQDAVKGCVFSYRNELQAIEDAAALPGKPGRNLEIFAGKRVFVFTRTGDRSLDVGTEMCIRRELEDR